MCAKNLARPFLSLSLDFALGVNELHQRGSCRLLTHRMVFLKGTPRLQPERKGFKKKIFAKKLVRGVNFGTKIDG